MEARLPDRLGGLPEKAWPHPMNLDDLALSWRVHLRAENKTDRTITLYLQTLRLFREWLVAHDREPTLAAMNRHVIQAWLADLTERGLAAGTVKVRFKGLQAFCKWL